MELYKTITIEAKMRSIDDVVLGFEWNNLFDDKPSCIESGKLVKPYKSDA